MTDYDDLFRVTRDQICDHTGPAYGCSLQNHKLHKLGGVNSNNSWFCEFCLRRLDPRPNAIGHRTQPPLIAGGQGRTDDDVEAEVSTLCKWTCWLFFFLFCIGVWALVAALIA